jgi:ketosteroid isomerase-like protein
VQRLYAAFAAGDVEALLQSIAPDVVWSEPDNPFNPAAGTRHGRSGVPAPQHSFPGTTSSP